MLADLQYGTTICLVCEAENGGRQYSVFKNELKGLLASGKCSFVEDIAAADFIVRINATSRESNLVSIGGINTFVAYVDASISISKGATKQVIYENNMSIKGFDTRSFIEAGRVAYKDLKKQIAPVIKKNTKQ